MKWGRENKKTTTVGMLYSMKFENLAPKNWFPQQVDIYPGMVMK